MSRFDVTSMREALAAAIRDRALRAGFDVYAYLPDSPTVPWVAVVPAPDWLGYHETFGDRASGTAEFEVVATCAYGAEDAQRKLDAFVSWGDDQPLSLIDALEAARDPEGAGALNGAVDDLVVLSARFRDLGVENSPLHQVRIRVQLFPRRGS